MTSVPLTLPAGNQFAVCGKRQKQGGRLPASSWNLGNGKVTPVVYLEGLHVCDSQALVLRYNWDSRLGADEVTDMVKARVIPAAVCEAQLLLYQEDRDGYITEEKSAVPVGGNVSSLLAITLAPGTRVNAESAVVRVVDDYAPDKIYADWNVNFTSTAYWYVYQPGLLPDARPQASQAPSVANQSGQPITLCYRMLWDTPWAPNLDPYIPEMGHNGAHTLSIKKVNGAVTSEIPFKQGDDALDSVAPTLPVDVRNLVIENVKIHNLSLYSLISIRESMPTAINVTSLSAGQGDTAYVNPRYVEFMANDLSILWTIERPIYFTINRSLVESAAKNVYQSLMATNDKQRRKITRFLIHENGAGAYTDWAFPRNEWFIVYGNEFQNPQNPVVFRGTTIHEFFHVTHGKSNVHKYLWADYFGGAINQLTNFVAGYNVAICADANGETQCVKYDHKYSEDQIVLAYLAGNVATTDIEQHLFIRYQYNITPHIGPTDQYIIDLYYGGPHLSTANPPGS